MAYFSNGTEGASYEARYCDRCVHQNGPDGKSGCAIWLSHLLYSYKLCNKKDEEGKQILDMLIPSDERGFPAQCAMFHEGKPVPDPSERGPHRVLPSMREWAKQRGLSVA